MGDVARFGIVGGKRVSLDGIGQGGKSDHIPPFVEEYLSSYGFDGIVDKIRSNADLTVADVESLLRNGSLPVLMKLVELKTGHIFVPQVIPVLVLPIYQWTNGAGIDDGVTKAVEVLSQHACKDLRVMVQLPESIKTSEIAETGQRLLEVAPGIKLVTPTSDALIRTVAKGGSALSWSERREALQDLLEGYRAGGFEHIFHGSYGGVLKLAGQLGLQNTLRTRIDCYPSPNSLAQELVRINLSTKRQAYVKEWSVGLTVAREPNAVLDLKLVRAFAVGCLCLNYIPFRSLCARSLSYDAMEMLVWLGANSGIFGGLDEYTQACLDIHPYEELREQLIR